jgi:hypothetical protein
MDNQREEINMKTEYIVYDETGHVSYSDKVEEPERFKTFAAAEKRAKELAKDAPGQPIRIYELVAETVVPTGAAETGRKYPIEHYR